MEEGESILDTLYEEDHLDDVEDVEMVDVEEGELVEHDSGIDLGQRNGGDSNIANTESRSKKRRAKKKKNKRKRSGPGQNVSDINRFVLDTCRRLKEKKSYMVYTAVGCLGVSALCDLVKEVDAIQACGGQMTADGRRSRTGGGILWSIIKAREPNAYKEIMKKAREFENQFKRPNTRQSREQGKDGSSQDIGDTMSNVSDGSQAMSEMQNNNQQSNDEEKRVSVHDRLRVPVSYDDDILGVDGDQKDDAT
ncbi:hypothetical protein UlMin_034964 [Ulmus minor]